MRITSKLEDEWYCVDFVKSEEETHRNAINKLGQIEDILDKYNIESPQALDEILRQYKYLGNHDYKTLPKEDFDTLFAELSKYKAIEKEFKIDLITLFKALKNGIWRKKFNKAWYVAPENLYIDNEMTFYGLYGNNYFEAIAKYNDPIFKWAFTKEELL